MKPAATSAWALAPTLRKAKASRFPTPLPWHLRWLAWALATLVPSLFYIGPAMLLLPPFVFLASPRAAIALLAADVVLATWPLREWPWFRGVFQLWYELFDVEHNLATDGAAPLELLPGHAGRTILAMHPHGIIPMQGFLWPALCDQYLGSRPGSPIKPLYGFGATTDVALRVPLLRQLLGWVTAGSAARAVLQRGLREKNLFILPGGVAEVFTAKPRTHVIIARRRGLMRLALRTGASLTPVYMFGGTDCFEQLATSGGGVFGRLSHLMRGGFTMFWGRFGLPLPCIPLPAKMSMVMADPVPVERVIAEPTDEECDALMERYADTLHRLFEQYKAQAGYPDAQLEIR